MGTGAVVPTTRPTSEAGWPSRSDTRRPRPSLGALDRDRLVAGRSNGAALLRRHLGDDRDTSASGRRTPPPGDLVRRRAGGSTPRPTPQRPWARRRRTAHPAAWHLGATAR